MKLISRLKLALKVLRGYELPRPPKPDPEIRRVWIPYAVTRHQLGSIDHTEVKRLKEDQGEWNDHLGQCAQVHKVKAFKRELDSMLEDQVYWMGQEALSLDQLNFGKGTVNGIALVRERFGELYAEYMKIALPDKQPTGLERHEIAIAPVDE